MSISYQQLASYIKEAARLHEESYSKKHEAYTLSVREAVNKAIPNKHKEFRAIVYLGLSSWWNDMLEWANNPSKYQ